MVVIILALNDMCWFVPCNYLLVSLGVGYIHLAKKEALTSQIYNVIDRHIKKSFNTDLCELCVHFYHFSSSQFLQHSHSDMDTVT